VWPAKRAVALLALLAAVSLPPEATAQPTPVASRYDRYGTGFRDSFERLKSRGYDAYVAELSAAHPSERAQAATMLGVLGDPRAIPVLQRFLKAERDEPTRHGAYVGLVLLGDRRHLASLRRSLRRDLPGYPQWVKTGIPSNPVSSAARSFRILAEYDVALPATVIDELFRRLDHVDGSVRIDAAVALALATGIGFGFRGDVSDTAAQVPRAEAWQRWWTDNRARYAAKQHYVVNGLELSVARQGDAVAATFRNHGGMPLRLAAPSPAPVKDHRSKDCGVAAQTLALVDARGAAVQVFQSDTGPCSAHIDPTADVLHWASIELAPGAAYSFTLPAGAAAPPWTLAYQAAACGAGRWCGELRSNLLAP
jgi:hypothetical protein